MGCSATGTQNLSGTRLPFSSDWTEVFGFSWERMLFTGYKITVGSNAQYLSAFNTSATENPTANFGPIWLLGANMGVLSESNNWRVELSGRNLLNVHYITIGFDRPGSPAGATDIYGPINRPREIWLQLTKNFGNR